MTAADYAADYNLFMDYIDPGYVVFTDAESFYTMPVAERERLAQIVIDANQ